MDTNELNHLLQSCRLQYPPPTLRDMARCLDRRIIREPYEVNNMSADILAELFQICIKFFWATAKLTPITTHFQKTSFQIPLRQLTRQFLERQTNMLRPQISDVTHLWLLLNIILRYFRMTRLGKDLVVPLPIVWLLILQFSQFSLVDERLIDLLRRFLCFQNEHYNYQGIGTATKAYCNKDSTIERTWQIMPVLPRIYYGVTLDYDGTGREGQIWTLDTQRQIEVGGHTYTKRPTSREGSNFMVSPQIHLAMPLLMMLLFVVITRNISDEDKSLIYNDPTSIWQWREPREKQVDYDRRMSLQRHFLSILYPDTMQINLVPFWLFHIVDRWQQFRA